MASPVLAWRKSSYSNQTGGHCVEMAERPGRVMMRDTRNRDLGHLSFPLGEWAAFLREVAASRP
ncbi:DUF397 domain-containing protein [Nocardiopsis suaedae]|uniref:DUF397 domain-containing protein n=1 Tax=Nocardiopsis suaedae TaxID=3018444 RepID=A0ABT4TTB9_9ACTN|nr:DUF397 domain-containing protein [Nocardiopsis suaedae]MDA2807696.1 DUF397 domain-containing protein [Nocardiopsis suaedae]